ncbi:methyl-accepting chemotaxis protein [Marinomonas sp. C2222]|uniref:Methyl-accepting chemotaxis protein n=1 Tax=Marinomonas sargassi TaxID=2984494 RepID=A0ABT2YRQ1_9GAMM|nr:methyl-accepting chemotaxis protein [Marinomonas sargassi]MCV2402425.1 methyl-accepting chemotaxis protein [Marinomonas sargassi]
MSSIQILLIVILGWFALSQMAKIGHEIKEISNDHLPLTNTLTLITEHQLQQAIALEKVVSHSLLDVVKGEKLSNETSALIQSLNTSLKKLHDEIVGAEKTITTLENDVELPESKAEYKKLHTEYIKIENEFFQLEKETNAFLNAITKDGIQKALGKISTLEKLNHSLDEHLIEVLNEVQQFSINAANQAYSDEQAAIKVIAIVLAIAVVLGIIIPYFISTSILKSLKELLTRLEDLVTGEGDLTIRLNFTSKDELGVVASKLDLFMEKLHRIISSVSNSSNQLNASSEAAVEVIQNTLNSVKNQKAETAEVYQAVDEMSKATNAVAQSTIEASDVANSVRTIVAEGKEAAERNQKITAKLAQDVQETSDSISNLAEETNNIGTVLDTIQGIAEQTNLLALNAAIEAARAGETGRGFAVVADEVRSLAQRVQTSTIDIQKLVESLQSGAEDAMKRMNQGLSVTQQCSEIGQQTATSFENTVNAVNHIAELNEQIATAAEQQAAVADQVQKNIDNINQIAQNTGEDASRVAQANEEIAMSVVNLNSDLNQFKV